MRRFGWDERQRVGVHVVSRLLGDALFFLLLTQLFPAALELCLTSRGFGGFAFRGELRDGEPRGRTLRHLRIMVALEDDAVEEHTVLQ